MDKRICDHAEAIFIRHLQNLSVTGAEERRKVLVDANRRGLSQSGIAAGNLEKVDMTVAGDRMKARLDSFKQAFEEAEIQPLPEDFKEIWASVEVVYKQSIGTIQSHYALRARRTGNPNAPMPNVQATLARYHDAVLGDYKVWVSRVGLAGVSKSFVVESVVPVNELKHGEHCAADLRKLLESKTNAAVLYIDLDNFKQVNDSAGGHDAGDRCIAEAARIIGSLVQHKGRLYRVHGQGDEFAVILPNYDASEARATAERIRSAIESQRPGGEITVTTSIGVVIGSAAASAESVMKQADEAMYAAKKTKNTVHLA